MPWIYAFVVALCLCQATSGQHANQISLKALNDRKGHVLTPEFSDYVEHVMEENRVPGLSLAVVRKDGALELGAWGNKTEDGELVTADTLYYIGSSSKAFTASAIGILMDDFATGRNVTALPAGLHTFNWDTKVKDILPGQWGLKDEWASEKANIRDILAHVSGLPRHDNAVGPFDTPKDIVLGLHTLEPHAELRETWSYNNMMYITAAHIISTYAGSFTAFVKERIFDPLNMTSTTYSLSEAIRSGEITQAWTSIGNGRRIPYWFNDDVIQLVAGAGGIISSAADMAKWVEMCLNSGVNRHTNVTIIPKSTFEDITTAHFIINGPEKVLFAPNSEVAGYGAGWGRASLLGHDLVTHGGMIPGLGSQVSFLPMDGVGLVALVNGDGKYRALLDIQKRVYMEDLGLQENVNAVDVQPDYQMPAPHGAVTTKPPIALEEYSGTYHNPGYGTFTLCAPSSDTSYCTQIKSDFASFGLDERPQLIAAWPRVWSSHLRMSHIAGNKFMAEFTALFPGGYGADESPFEAKGDRQSVEFITEDGKVVGFELCSNEGCVDALFKKT